MTLKNELHDVTSFLPSFWTSNLQNVPTLGLKYELIDLDSDFIEFLGTDGLTLDEDRPFSSGFSSSEDDYSDSDSLLSETYMKPSEMFPELHEKIKLAVCSLGGSVVPKLNWTVPKDSIWISANTLKCTSANEIYQLLKASDRIQSDLELQKTLDVTPQLFLRPFVEIRHENEFRVFVFNGSIIAVAQRNLDVFDSTIQRRSQEIIDNVEIFFDKFFRDFGILKYSFDIYISDDLSEICLVDVNPLFESSPTGLFKYKELEEHVASESSDILFRCIQKNEDCIIAAYERNFLPVDLLNSGTDINNLDFNNFPR